MPICPSQPALTDRSLETCRLPGCDRANFPSCVGDRRLQVRRPPERRISCNSLPRSGPHIRHIQIGTPIAIVIEPGGAHAGSDIFHARFRRLVPKPAATVSVEVISSEIVGHVEIGPTIAIEIAPCRREAEAVIVLIHATRIGDILKEATIGRQSIPNRKFGGPFCAS